MASRARWAALSSYLAILVVLFAAALVLLQVPRAPLPRDEIASLANLTRPSEFGGHGAAFKWPTAEIRIAAADGAFATGPELKAFAGALEVALAAQEASAFPAVSVSVMEAPSSRLRALIPCAGDAVIVDDSVSSACSESLEDASASESVDDSHAGGAGLSPQSVYELLVAAALPGQPPMLLLSTGMTAVLRRGSDGAGDAALAKALALELRRTWLRVATFERTATLFELAPSYMFSFFLVGDCQRRVAWDFFGGVISPYMRRLLDRLRLLFDLELDAQVVQCGSLGKDRGRADVVYDPAALQDDFLRRFGELPGDTLTRDARWLSPLLHFVAFKPSSSGLRIVDSDGETQQSFAVQGWGAVVVTTAGDQACGAERCVVNASSSSNSDVELLSSCEAVRTASAWTAHLRSWLLLPDCGYLPPSGASQPLNVYAAPPRHGGIADWELRVVAQGVYTLFVRRTAETLEDLVALVDSLPDVTVRAEIGELASEAVHAALNATAAAAAGSLVVALAAARRALTLALTASHDDTVVAHLYFSLEFKYAVYLPIGLPVIVPIVVAAMRQSNQAMKVRSMLRKAESGAASFTEVS